MLLALDVGNTHTVVGVFDELLVTGDGPRIDGEIPGLLHHWQLGFLCRRCGWVYYSADGGDTVAASPRFDLGYR